MRIALVAAILAAAVAIACSNTQESAPTATAPPAQPQEPTATPAAMPAQPQEPTATPAAMPAPTSAARQPAPMAVATSAMTEPPVEPLDSLPAETAYGDYAVGTATGFAVDNRQRFDPWNSAYASPRYREMLRRVEASGQTRTVVFQMWYPATPDTSAGRLDGPRSPFPAAEGQRASYADSFFQDSGVLSALMGGGAQPGSDRILAAPRGAWLDAPPADGKFPLIILAHGLGGNHAMWGSFAEFLASNGYVVAAPTFISDGSPALVFHDEDSPFARQSTPEEVGQAYRMIMGEFKVIPSFYRLMFGIDAPGFDAQGSINPSTAKIAPGGIERATTMMRNLFRQRVSDVGLLTHTMRMLGEAPDACRTSLESMGATSAARGLCGLLEGRIDGERVGVGGHSLGSMTAQMAVNHLPGVSAAMGFNNAPPFTWTPEEIYGAGETEDGLPIGSGKPVLIMVGDEDAFVQGVFSGLFQGAVSQAGGDPAAAFPLEDERALPDRIENPQPVALSAWRRAVSDRILAIVRDVNHGTLVDDSGAGRGAGQQLPRKPTGQASLTSSMFGPPGAAGESYTPLGWAALGDGTEAYMPHVIRDWYARIWFDWYLKGDEDAHSLLKGDDPFGAMTHARRDVE